MKNEISAKNKSARNCALACAALLSATLVARLSVLEGMYAFAAMAAIILVGPSLRMKLGEIAERWEVTAEDLADIVLVIMVVGIMGIIAWAGTLKALEQGAWSTSVMVGLVLSLVTSIAAPVCFVRHNSPVKSTKVVRSVGFVLMAATVMYAMLSIVVFTDSFTAGLK